ncbi:MAG: hypothetical protein ACW987_20000 [Candidatus Thorarchaeota archaeon]|jgi:hypothetical protein
MLSSEERKSFFKRGKHWIKDMGLDEVQNSAICFDLVDTGVVNRKLSQVEKECAAEEIQEGMFAALKELD